MLIFAPSAWAATSASVSGNTLNVSVTGTSPTEPNPARVTVTLCNPQASGPCIPASATAPACDVDPCTTGTGPNPAVYEVHDPGGVAPSASCPSAAYPGAPVDNTRVWCPRGGALWGAFTVNLNGDPNANNIRLVAALITGGEGNTGDIYWIRGNGGNDTLVGGENNDFMSGGAGNDVMEGYAGNDILTGWEFQGGGTLDAVGLPLGIDFINGSFSAASLSTAAGTDRIFGGGGSDIVTDGDRDDGTNTPTADVLSGWSCPGIGAAAGGSCPVPADTLNSDVSENDIDELYWGHRTKAVRVTTSSPSPQGGCPTTAACTSGGENEVAITFRGVYSGAGNDTLIGHAGAAGVGNTFYGGAGNDRLDGLDGNDELIGGDGPDTLLGGAGGDFLNPGGHVVTTGANTTMTSDGADTVDGGANGSDTTGDGSTAVGLNDLITYSGRSDNLTLNLNATTGWGAAGENDSVTGVEDITGGHGADTITLRSGLGSIVEADPIAPELAHPGEPPLPSPPPGGYFSNDTVHARNGMTDTIDCGGDAADPDSDTVVADRTPSDGTAANCETIDLPPLPPPPPAPPAQQQQQRGGTTAPGVKQSDGTITHNDPTTTVKIAGGPSSSRKTASAGSVKVKKDGSFTLSKFMITCPVGSKSCSVKTIAAKYGTKSYSLKGGTKGAAKGKLSKKGMKQLKKRKRLKATITIRVVHNGRTTTRKVKATFRR